MVDGIAVYVGVEFLGNRDKATTSLMTQSMCRPREREAAPTSADTCMSGRKMVAKSKKRDTERVAEVEQERDKAFRNQSGTGLWLIAMFYALSIL